MSYEIARETLETRIKRMERDLENQRRHLKHYEGVVQNARLEVRKSEFQLGVMGEALRILSAL